MKVGELPREIREMLGMHEAFRRLGFTSDQITIVVGQGPQYVSTQVYLLVKTTPEFSVRICPLWCSVEELRTWWQVGADLWNASSDDESGDVWDASEAKRRFTQIALAIESKGIPMVAVNEVMKRKQAERQH